MPLVKKTSTAPAVASSDLHWRAEVTRLQTGTADERWLAARALGAEPLAIPALDAALAEPAGPRLREAIFTSLAGQNSPAAFDAILRHLRSDDAELRSFALDAMLLMSGQSAQFLPSLLEDADPDVRVLACELGRQIAPQISVPLLARLLEIELQVNVCAAAIEVLAEIGGLSELPLLAACAVRFPTEYFLNFSVTTAAERIRARAGT